MAVLYINLPRGNVNKKTKKTLLYYLSAVCSMFLGCVIAVITSFNTDIIFVSGLFIIIPIFIIPILWIINLVKKDKNKMSIIIHSIGTIFFTLIITLGYFLEGANL